MYTRGSDRNIEYKRYLNGFFRGIVVDDNDPLELQRVRVFIPEITNIGEESDINEFIAPHKIGSIKPEKHQKILELVPFAEQASGLFGEYGNSHYSAALASNTSKATYVKTKTDSKVPNSKDGGYMPRQAEANINNAGAGSSMDDFTNTNPHCNSYLPKNSGPEVSGVFGVPSVGSHVWVFFDRGDINCPVYFAHCPSIPETAKVYQDGGYPNGFSTDYNKEGVEDKPPEPRPGTPGQPVNSSQYQPTVYGTAFEGGTPENPFGNGNTLDLTTKLETGTTARDAAGRQKYGLRQIPQEWQFLGTRNNTLIPGYHIAVDRVDGRKWPRGTILNINGSNYEVADRAGSHIRNKYGRGPIDFYAGNSRELYDKFKNIKIESIEVVRVGPGTS